MEIEAVDLRKSYAGKPERVEALRGVDLEVPKGRIFGFLGPNGAGKTTVTRIFTTLSRPGSGTARVAGFDVVAQADRVRRRIGYVSQAGGVDTGVTGRASLMLQARLQGMGKAEAETRADELVARFGLAAVVDRPAGSLSGGQSRRLALAMGLVHRPPVVFLDEPTLGLDPRVRVELWREIEGLRAEGTTVFLTTHYLEEADALCDDLAIIDAGRIVGRGTPAALKREAPAGEVISVTATADDARRESLARRAALLPCSREAAWDGDVLRVRVDDGGEAVPLVLRQCDAEAVTVRSVTLSGPTLADVFLQKTGRTLESAESAEGVEPAEKSGTAKNAVQTESADAFRGA